ncbi:MAG: acetylglutamate kinase [Muribaculaceae bacterium]
MKEKLTIVKVGGKIVEEPDSLQQLLEDFASIDGNKLLVHGGGRSATKLAERLGVKTTMVEGRRITDDAMIEIVTMVYGGLVNKRIVAGLQAKNVNALGMTGADMNIILSEKRAVKETDYGWVGDVKIANGTTLSKLISTEIVPVIAPLTHDGKGNMLNTNADTMAGETAKSLAKLYDVTLIFCFEKEGVLRDENDDNSAIAEMTKPLYEQLRKDGVINGGMIPKLDNSFSTIEAGVKEVIITKASNLNDISKGTHIK